MCFDRQFCFLFSVLCLVRADRNDTTAAQVSRHYGKQQVDQATVLDIGNQATMQKHSDMHWHVKNRNFSKGNFLTELYFCPRSEDLKRFQLGPFAHSVSYNNFDLTGSTWKPTTFDQAVVPGLGFAKDLQGGAAAYAKDGSVPVEFAYINDGPAFAPAGGFIFKDKSQAKVIGAMEICSQDDDTVGYKMAFKPGVSFGNEVPTEFSVGRMQRVSLPQLQQAGAKRYTWIHGDFVRKYFGNAGGGDADKGGFLYEVNDGAGSRLEFYERLAYPDSSLYTKGAGMTGGGGYSGGGMTGGGMTGGGGVSPGGIGQTVTIHIGS